MQNQLENYVLVVAVHGSVSGWEDELNRGFCDLFWMQYYLPLFNIYHYLPF